MFQVHKDFHIYMLVIDGGGGLLVNVLSAKRSPHLNVGY